MRSALVLCLCLGLLTACGTPPAASFPAPRLIQSVAAAADLEAGHEELSMEVIELICSPCAAQIVSRSRQLPGVTRVSMVLATKTLTVRFDPALIARDRVIASVEQIVASIQ